METPVLRRHAGPFLTALLGLPFKKSLAAVSHALLACSLLAAKPAPGKLPVSVLGTWVEGRDSLYCASLSRDLGQTLADDTAFLVYDLRRKHGRLIDSLQGRGELGKPAFLAALGGGQVKWGLAAECAEEKREDERGDWLCRLTVLPMGGGAPVGLQTMRFLPEAAEKRKRMGQNLARQFEIHFLPRRADAPSMGSIKVNPPANPALLIRGLQILRRGPIAEVPLGATLVVGDAPGLAVVSMEDMHYILYPKSSYTYLLPKVVQLNAGTIGLLRGIDSGTIAGRLKSAAALDSSNLIWRNLAKVAALDSSNLIWRSLGKVSSLDSSNLIWRSLGKVSSLDSSNILLNNLLTRGLGKAAVIDSSNLLLRALGNVTSLDSTNMILRTLGQVAALDTSNFVWKGLGKVSALDSSNFLWQKLGRIASMDSNSIWRKLGLLAFQESTIVITSSFIARGLPQAALVRQDGNVSTLEVIRGSMVAHPLLGSQPPEQMGALRIARTRGFALRQERMNPMRADRILREFEAVNPERGMRSLADFLPGKLFAVGASLRTPDRAIQSFIAGEHRELDMEMDILSTERDAWNDLGVFRTGSQEIGCYLCSPDRIGP